MRKAILLSAVLLAACGSPGPPYSPKQARGKFQIERGWRIEPFASEPDIVSPVAMVEDRGYPLNYAQEGELR